MIVLELSAGAASGVPGNCWRTRCSSSSARSRDRSAPGTTAAASAARAAQIDRGYSIVTRRNRSSASSLRRDEPQRIAGVIVGGGDGLGAREETRYALEAGQRRLDVRRRRGLCDRQPPGHDVRHRRGGAARIFLQQLVGGGLRRLRVAGDVELVHRDLQQRGVSDRALRERVDDRLEILDRLGVSPALQNVEAALYCRRANSSSRGDWAPSVAASAERRDDRRDCSFISGFSRLRCCSAPR